MRDDWVTQLAYTGAEAFVSTVHTANFDWLRQRLSDVLGPQYPQHLADSRDRLDPATARANGQTGDPRVVEVETRSAEIKAWFERLVDAVRDRPELAIRLRSIVDEAGVRLLLSPPVPATHGLF